MNGIKNCEGICKARFVINLQFWKMERMQHTSSLQKILEMLCSQKFLMTLKNITFKNTNDRTKKIARNELRSCGTQQLLPHIQKLEEILTTEPSIIIMNGRNPFLKFCPCENENSICIMHLV